MAHWRDIDNNLKKANNGDIYAQEDVDAIHNSLTNIFSTFQGSRRMVPEFALPIYGLLFEPIDAETAQILGEMIFRAIEKWETRIFIENIHVQSDPDNNLYRVLLTYKISLSSETQNFETILRIV